MACYVDVSQEIILTVARARLRLYSPKSSSKKRDRRRGRAHFAPLDHFLLLCSTPNPRRRRYQLISCLFDCAVLELSTASAASPIFDPSVTSVGLLYTQQFSYRYTTRASQDTRQPGLRPASSCRRPTLCSGAWRQASHPHRYSVQNTVYAWQASSQQPAAGSQQRRVHQSKLRAGTHSCSTHH